jgi:hypothetical protein
VLGLGTVVTIKSLAHGRVEKKGLLDAGISSTPLLIKQFPTSIPFFYIFGTLLQYLVNLELIVIIFPG